MKTKNFIDIGTIWPDVSGPRCRSPPLHSIFRNPQKNRMEENIMATKINLRDFYPHYTHDEFVEVSEEVAAELFAGKRYQKHHEQRMRRNLSIYSLDTDDGIETSAIASSTYNPEEIFTKLEKHCHLCCALNSLPETQGRRIEAHYLLGKSQAEIAEDESVTKGSVSIAITRGLAAMKIFYKNFDFQSNFCPLSEGGI